MQSGGNRIQVVETSLRSLIGTNRFSCALFQNRPVRMPQAKDTGELAIQSMVNRVRPELSEDVTALVLSEDSRVTRMSLVPMHESCQPGRCH